MISWHNDIMTQSQKEYIRKIEHETGIPFVGKTKVEAARYIESSRKSHKKNKDVGRTSSEPKRGVNSRDN